MEHQGIQMDHILEHYPGEPEYLIFLLQDIQSSYGYISAQAMQSACERAGVPLSQGYAVATFYQCFRLDPKGENEIRVCLGTACHLKGGQRLVEDLERRLKVRAGETTPDLRYTLNTVRCVGACALAPVVVINEAYQPNMSARKLDQQFKILEGQQQPASKGGAHG